MLPPSKRESSILVQTFIEADRLRQQALRDGATKDEANDIVTQALRQAWPKDREEPWHYLCELCGDTGWRVRICMPALRCGRPFKLPKQPAEDKTGQGRCRDGHTYAEPCECPRGVGVRRRLLREPSADPDSDLTQAGHVTKPSRFGR